MKGAPAAFTAAALQQLEVCWFIQQFGVERENHWLGLTPISMLAPPPGK